MTFNAHEYYEMYKQYLDKKISDDLWILYCSKYLQKLMEKHSDVLKRLK